MRTPVAAAAALVLQVINDLMGAFCVTFET
jgi:hypothetical protein